MLKTLLTSVFVLSAATAQAGDRVTLLMQLETDPRFTTLLDVLEAADLQDTLSTDGPFTLYAPTNAAFAAMPEGTLAVLQLPANAERLAEVISYHLDDRRLTSHHFAPGAAYYRPVLEDTRLCILNADEVTIDDGSGEIATVIEADIKVSNGVIHVIDKVLIPAEKPACSMPG